MTRAEILALTAKPYYERGDRLVGVMWRDEEMQAQPGTVMGSTSGCEGITTGVLVQLDRERDVESVTWVRPTQVRLAPA